MGGDHMYQYLQDTTHMEYESWCRGVPTYVYIGQDVQEVTLSAGGETQPASRSAH
jgi:hypothetical protein